jgi:amino acid transporter
MFPLATTQTWAAAQVASAGQAVMVYLIGTIAMIFTGLSYKFMSGEYQVAGGGYSYVQRGMNPVFGFIAGWVIVLDYSIIPGMLVKFSTLWLSLVTDAIPSWLVIIAFLAITTTVVALGNTVSKWVNYAFFWGQIGFIVYLAIATLVFVSKGHGMGHISFAPIFDKDTFDLDLLRKAVSIGMLGFIGADTIASMSEEAKNSVKSIGRAVLLSIVTIGFLFTLVAYMAGLAHPDFTTLNPDTGLFDVVREVGGDTFFYVTVIGCVLFVGVANVIPPLSAISRVLFAMGRDNALPFSSFFAKVSPRTNTPLNATLFIGVLSLIIAFTVSLDNLSRLVSFGAMSTYFLLNITVIVHFLFKKKVRTLVGYIKYGLSPFIGACVILFIFTGFDVTTYIVGGIWLALGLIYMAARYKHFKVSPLTIEE